MDDNHFIEDNGIFFNRPDFRFTIQDQYDTVQNLFHTVQEYREFANPDSHSWMDYIQEFYHLLGFNTESYNSRVCKLQEIGQNTHPQIIVGISLPNEYPGFITSWLDWESYLELIANDIRVSWGIWTNGKIIKFYDFLSKDSIKNYCKVNLEGILEKKSEDSFFAFYKIICFLKKKDANVLEKKANESSKIPVQRPYTQVTQKTVSKESSQYANIYEKIAAISKKVDRTHQSKAWSVPLETPQSLPSSLHRTIQVYKEMTENQLGFMESVDKIAKKHQVTFQTVKQDCSLKIRIKTEVFCELVLEPEKLKKHLQMRYPKNKNDIEKMI